MVVDTGPVWLPVVGYETTYLVSSDGQVWSHPRKGTRGGLVHQYKSRWGYMYVKIVQDSRSRTVSVHRLVGEAFLGPQPDGLETRHLDGNSANNAAGNLRYGTKSENARDRIRHGHHSFANKTHCPQGHPYDETNTRLTSTGARYCLECKRVKNRAGRARRLALR